MDKGKELLEGIKQLAKARKGKLLSTEYINSRMHLQWECQYGHRWMAKPNDVKSRKTWCPTCYKNTWKRNQKKINIAGKKIKVSS
jgi:hypothetical protein